MQSSLFIDPNTLNVGIGTTRPKTKLHVEGTITASNMSILGDFVTLNTITSNTEQMVITNAGTGPALKVTQTGAHPIADFYDDGDVLAMRIADGGNVGIGTATPTSKLHVTGGISCTTLDLTGYSTTEFMFPPLPFNNTTTINNSGFSSTTMIMQGTNYGAGSYTVTDNGVSSLAVSTQGGWAAFDNNLTTRYQSYGPYNSASQYYYSPGHFVQLQIPKKVKLRRYTVYAPASSDDPKDWTLEGSNDGTNWTSISSIIGEIWSSASTKEYITNSNIGYTYFRFRVTRVAGAVEVRVYELKYYGYEEYFVGIGTTTPCLKVSNSILNDSGRLMVNQTSCVLQNIHTTTAGGAGLITTSAYEIISLSITPSSTSSKVLIFANVNCHRISGTGYANGVIRRNTTTLTNSNFIDDVGYNFNNQASVCPSICYLDSPATTSAISYNVYISPSTSDQFRWRNITLLLQEIAG